MGFMFRKPSRNTLSAKLAACVFAAIVSVFSFFSVGMYLGIAMAVLALMFGYEAFVIGVKHRAVRFWEMLPFIAIYLLILLLPKLLAK
ncbi:MAG: hypothetical protein PHY48_00540 [Candidatus Cloacimonetes bacterium]|nr:hypothetical protein [Candidatus Cloacimonadota bacterium]